MKGFLNKPETKSKKSLYGKEGSSGTGMKEGTYSRFMSKCKVVDTSTMTEDEQRKAMASHANGRRPQVGSQGQPPNPPQKEMSAPKETAQDVDKSFKNLGMKGFLEGKNKLYGNEGSSEGGGIESKPSGGAGTFDAEFMSLMESADPEFASQFDDPRIRQTDKEGDALNEVFKGLADTIGGMPEMGMGGGGAGKEEIDVNKLKVATNKKISEKKKNDMKKREMRSKALELSDDSEAAASVSAPASCISATATSSCAFSLSAAQLPHELKNIDEHTISVTMDLSSAPPGKLLMDDIDLQISRSFLLMSTAFGTANVNLQKSCGKEVDEDSVVAKLSQKKRTLKIILKKI